jgi:hypothetical protein
MTSGTVAALLSIDGHTLKTSDSPYLCTCGSQFVSMQSFSLHIDGLRQKAELTPPVDVRDKSFEEFARMVLDSVDGQARRKGYTVNGADGDNALFQFTSAIGAANGHAIGEIIYKATEYMNEPREVLLFKIAGWSFLLWKFFDDQKRT